MTRVIRACIFTDEIASYEVTQEEEYLEIEKLLATSLPAHDFLFTRDVEPNEVLQKPMDLYAFDFGGLCAVDMSGDYRLSLCRYILQAATERPNVLFIPLSSFSISFMVYATGYLFPELVGSPNVWTINDEVRWAEEDNDSLRAKLKEWFQ